MNQLGLSEELWKVVAEHYIKECYTDCLTDVVLYLYSILKYKTGVETEDGEKLCDKVFSNNNPMLLINQNITESEKDEQRGFLYLFKWLTASIRNPISHDKCFKFDKTETDAILLLVNSYILKRLDDSRDFSYVNDWYGFIFIKNELDSKDYSDSLLNAIPKRKRIELMNDIVESLESIQMNKYSYFIDILFSSLTSKEKRDICNKLNDKLLNNNKISYYASFFDHFNPVIFSLLDRLTRAKIENYVYDEINTKNKSYQILLNVIIKWIPSFKNSNDVNKRIFELLCYDISSASCILYKLSDWYYNYDLISNHEEQIIEQLKRGNIYMFKVIENINSKKKIRSIDITNQMNSFKSNDDWELPF